MGACGYRLQKDATRQRKQIQRAKKCDDLSVIKALPTGFDELADLAENHPSDSLLKPGEQWVMMDSGANVDAANIAQHFPDYLELSA